MHAVLCLNRVWHCANVGLVDCYDHWLRSGDSYVCNLERKPDRHVRSVSPHRFRGRVRIESGLQ